jgi:uncharacterized protein (TIGR00645 family)
MIIERLLAKFFLASRWLLAPFYIGLVLGLVALLVKMAEHVWHAVPQILESREADVILAVLGLIDLTLTASLVVIVILAGYENFVARIEPSENWPEWMGKIDFTGLKLKLLSSIVAISAIQLLRAFMDIGNVSDRDLAWYGGLLLVFVVSGLLLAITDRLSGEKH